jgi:aminomethyltransferase
MPTTKTQLKRTPLYERHVRLGAKMVEFAGFELPIQYAGIMEEHAAVRTGCGVFDVSHLGEIRVSGPAAADFIERLVPTETRSLADFEIRYTVLLDDRGGVLDDILIYRLDTRNFYIVVNAATSERDFRHIESRVPAGVFIANDSDRVACIAIQGPRAAAVSAAAFGEEVPRLGYYRFRALPDWGKSAWISRTGYTGEDGFEVFGDAETVVRAWDRLLGEGSPAARPVGLGARDTLRLEAGNVLYGTDLDETRTPYEARLGWLVSPAKGDYVGRKALLERREAGFRERLAGFRVAGRGIPRHGYPILKDGRRAGTVTSGSFSPTLQAGIGLGYVEWALAGPGECLEIEIHGRPVPAETAKLPFVPLKHK